MKKKKRLAVISILMALVVTFTATGGGIFLAIFVPKQMKKRAERAEWERLVKECYDNKLSLYEKENAEYDDYEVDVAFLGDSLTEGYKLEKYYPQYTTANRGIGGETTYGLESRLKVSAYDLKPKVVVMLIGGNNLSTMLDNYEDILVGLQQNLPETDVVLVSLTAMGGEYARYNQLAAYNNVTIEKLAAKYGYCYVDVFTPLFDESTGEIYTQYTSDSVHLTVQGYEVLTNAVTPTLATLLG